MLDIPTSLTDLCSPQAGKIWWLCRFPVGDRLVRDTVSIPHFSPAHTP